MENLINLFSSLLSNKSNSENNDSSPVSSLLPLLSSMMENNKKGATEVAPQTLSAKLNHLMRTTE